MDEQELLQELDNFLNEKGLYNDFLKWAEDRGFDADELDSDYGRLIG
jgi:hypothetical protein